MSEEKEKEKLELKLRLLTMNCMYISYKNKTLENIFKGITNKECLGLFEEKLRFDKYSDTFLEDLLLSYIIQKDEDLKALDGITDDYASTMSIILSELNEKLTVNNH